MHSITSIDNAVGAGAMLGISSRGESGAHGNEIWNCKFYGKSPIPDCPNDNQCTSITKAGLLASTHSVASHPEGNMELHPTKDMHLPLSVMIKDSSWAGYVNYHDLDFYNFDAETERGEKNIMIQLNKKASDYIQYQELTRMRFHNCQIKAMTHFFEPPDAWANPADCGDFPCTGPKNTIFFFYETEFDEASTVPEGMEGGNF